MSFRHPVMVLALLAVMVRPGPAQQSEERHFRLGFTAFPPDITLPAVIECRKFCREHGDIIAHHIEGVAWSECLKDLPFPEKRIVDWTGKKDATPDGGKVYLAISPGRGDLKLLEDCRPLAPELEGKSYDDPLVMKVYLAYCRRMIAFFKPDYLAIGIEVNDIYKDAGPDAWRAYVTLHRFVYESLKKEYPDLPIFASATLHNLVNRFDAKRTAYSEAFTQVMPYCDFVAISYYPFIQGHSVGDREAFQWLTQTFDHCQKPYAIVETGETAQDLTFPSSGQVVHGTAERQREYLRELIRFADSRDCRFVIWFLHQDYDRMWDKIRDFSPEAFMAWRDNGLLNEAGETRPALGTWNEAFARPLLINSH